MNLKELSCMSKYKQVTDGEWVKPQMRDYKMECCDCGLKHRLDFLIVDGETQDVLNGTRVLFRAYRIGKPKKSGRCF